MLRAKGHYTPEHYHRWLAPRLGTLREEFLAHVLALVPGCLVNLPILLYFRLFRSLERYGLVELKDSPFYYKNCLRRLFSTRVT
jgi:hypothetical protein